jgi:hypothetical protein
MEGKLLGAHQRDVMDRGLLLALLGVAATLNAAEDYPYWVDECTPELARASGCQAGDAELARWAFETWQRETNGALVFHKSATEAHARLRLHWAGGDMNLYGETLSVMVDGQSGAVIYVLPDTSPLGRADPLMRDAIVYLTCLHESGHALGLRHTSAFADIMYSFAYGGDITAYFGRYRTLLKTRQDIPGHSGISVADRAAIRGTVK